jgi:amino acid transporter
MGMLDFSLCTDKESLLLLLLLLAVGALGTTSMLMRAAWSAEPPALAAYEQLVWPVRMLSELHPAGAPAAAVLLLLLLTLVLLLGSETGHPVERKARC